MTGNVVFVGFALAGAPGFSLVASLLALAGFLLGAAAGGPVITRFGASRGRLLAVVVTAEMGLLATTTVLTMTLTGFAADLRQRNGQVLLRRALAVTAMLAGAFAGAALVVGESAAWALALALLLVTVVWRRGMGVRASSRRVADTGRMNRRGLMWGSNDRLPKLSGKRSI